MNRTLTIINNVLDIITHKLENFPSNGQHLAERGEEKKSNSSNEK